MKKLYVLVNGERINDDTVNNRCNRFGKIIIKNKGDFYIPKSSNFDEIDIFSYNNEKYITERIFKGERAVGSMDFIIHGIFDHFSINADYKIIYYKKSKKNEKLDGLVENYNENVIKKKLDIYPAWPYTFEVKNHPEYDYDIDRTSQLKKFKTIVSGTYELIKDLFF